MLFSFRFDVSSFQRSFSDLEKTQLPFAVANALNDSMFEVRKDWQDGVKRSFDRPTLLTQNAVLYRKAKKERLIAEVFLRNESVGTPPARYLLPQVEGGAREEKPFEFLLRQAGVLGANEFAIPSSSAPLDAYGNLPKGVVVTILADLQATRDEQARSTSASRTKRARRKAVSKRAVYFYSHGPSGNRGDGRPQHLPRGIYQRTSFALGSSIRLILAIVESAPSYGRKFDAYGLAESSFHRSFPINFRKRLDHAVRTARIK